MDKSAELRLLKLNQAQRVLFGNWSNRMILCKSRQLGISTAILGYFFIEALLTPGLVVAVVSHEDYATKRLLDKLDIFHRYLPKDIQPQMFHNSDHEKSFPNGSTIYIGTAGQRAFGRGDTIHRALVSEEAHYADAKKLLTGLAEAVPMGGYLVRESTPLGDSGYYYDSVQACLEGRSDYRLVPFYWWYGEDYSIPRGSSIVMEEERGVLSMATREVELVLEKGLDEDRIRWRRWKQRNMGSAGEQSPFPQEYIEDLESCFIGPKDRVFSEVDEQLETWALRAREPKIDGVAEYWREPQAGERYIMWLDPAGGESPTEGDPHDGVVLRLHPGGLEQVAALCSRMEQKPLAYKAAELAGRYNNALLVVERNGVGRGVLNYLQNDVLYPNLYMERDASGETTGRYGWNTSRENKALMVSNTKSAIKAGTVVSYDRKLVRQLKALIIKDGKIEAKAPARDDRAMAFMGAITVSPMASSSIKLAVGEFVTFKGRSGV